MASETLTLVILAAGLGRRYGGLKQLEPMGPGEETLLDYSVFDALRAGFERVIFVIRRDFETAFRDAITKRYSGKIRVDYAFQELLDVPEGFSIPNGRVQPWGTLHAVRAARHIVDGPFAVINADDFYGQDAYHQLASYLGQPSPSRVTIDHYCMVGYPIKRTLSAHGGVNRGICVESDGFLVAIEECTQIVSGTQGQCRGINPHGKCVEFPWDALASMNFWGFTPAIFSQMERFFSTFLKARGHDSSAECYIPDMVDDIIRAGEADCRILQTGDQWFGVTHPQDKMQSMANIHKLIEAGVYPKTLWE